MINIIFTSSVLHLIISVTAIAGFLVALHIRRKKREAKPFVCPLNFDCHSVVHSQYSKVLGIPLEIVGMIYYAIIAVSYFFFLFFPEYHHYLFGNAVLFVTVFAFFFSMYLVYIQAAKLKQWCTWCLFSALFCTIIFLAVLALSFV